MSSRPAQTTDPQDVTLDQDPRLGPPPGGSGSMAERAARMIDEDPRMEEFALKFYGVTAEEVAAAREASTSKGGTR